MSKIIFLGGEDVSARIEISKKFIALGYEIEIIGTEKEDKFIKNNIPYKKYSLNRELNVFEDLKTVFELRRMLKDENATTIVHAFDTKPTMFLPIVAIGLRQIRVVRTITGMGRIFTVKSFKNNVLITIYNLIQKTISKRVDFTVFQNDDDSKYFLENKLIDKDKSSVIKSSGIDLKKYAIDVDSKQIDALKKELSIDYKKPTFVLVSRMVKQKGITDYLEAAKLCKKSGHNYNFLLVGQIDSNKDSITKEEILRYNKYVNYLGRREDVKELLFLSDIFVLPTYYREGVPRVLLEASAMGLALLATDMPGCKDVVRDDYNGKLVKTQDSNDLVDKMIYIASDNERLKKFGENSKEFIKLFDLDIIVDRYHQIYKKLHKEL